MSREKTVEASSANHDYDRHSLEEPRKADIACSGAVAGCHLFFRGYISIDWIQLLHKLRQRVGRVALPWKLGLQ